jgi:hypothetical protein
VANIADFKMSSLLTKLMDNDLLTFFAAAGLMILYLFFSAFTEMGTKLPWKK